MAYATLAARLPNLPLLGVYKTGPTSDKVHRDRDNELDYRGGKADKSARREYLDDNDTDLMAVRANVIDG